MTDLEQIAQGLLAAVRRGLPDAREIAGLRALPGGASQETWAFDAVTGEARVPLILRRSPPGSRLPAEAIGLENEAALLQEVRAHDVPVPYVLSVLREDDGIGRGYVMERVAGEANSRRILRDERYAQAREQLAFQCGQALARFHRVALDRLPALRRGQAREEVAYSSHWNATCPRRRWPMRWCTATSATGTSWSTSRACARSWTGRSRTSATRWKTSAGCA